MLTAVVADGAAVVTDRLDTVLIASAVSLFLPLLVNLVTKHTASDGLKSVINLIASAVISTLVLWTNPTGVPVTWYVIGNTFIASLIASFTAYKAVWKPTGLSGTVASKTANFGLGSPPVVETADKGAEEGGV